MALATWGSMRTTSPVGGLRRESRGPDNLLDLSILPSLIECRLPAETPIHKFVVYQAAPHCCQSLGGWPVAGGGPRTVMATSAKTEPLPTATGERTLLI